MGSFAGPDGTFFPNTGNIAVAAPATGSTVKMKAGQRAAYFNHGATIAALTVWLPPAPKPNDLVSLKFNQIVTTLSIRNSAGVVVGTAPVSAAQGQAVDLRYTGKTTGWVWW